MEKLIQYVNILTKEGKSLLFRNYGTSEVDRNLADVLSAFSGFIKEISQSDIKSTQTEDFKYFYTKIDTIIIVVCADLKDDDNSINSKILTIRTRFIEKYGKILENGRWVGNRTLFYDFEKELDNLFLGAIKTSILGFGNVGKTELTKLICGKDVDLEYVPTINADIASYEGDEFGRSITLWDFAGQAQFRSLWKSLLEDSDIVLLVTDSTFEKINNSKEIIHEILDKYFKDKLVIGIANYQDMPNRLSPKFCERVFSDKGRTIRFHGIDACNPVYRDKIIAVLRNVEIKIFNGKEEITCEQCGNTFTREFFEILNQTEPKVKDLFYCLKCNFPLRYIYYENCLQIRSFNPLIKSEALKERDYILNKRFRENWIDYFGLILKKKDQIYSNIELEYLEVQNKLDYIAESFFSGDLDEKIFKIYQPYVEKCNFPRIWEKALQIPKYYFLEKGDITYIIIGVLLDLKYSLILEKIASFIENLFYTNFINIDNLNKSVKVRIRDDMESFIIMKIENYLESGDLIFLEEAEEQFVPRAKPRTNSHWKLKLEVSKLKKKERREFIISCPMCNIVGKENFKIFEDKSKILSYVHVIPMYAKKYKCKRCGYEF